MDLELGKKESLVLATFDTIGGGELKKLVDQYLAHAVSESLLQQKMNIVEQSPIKISIDITVKPLEEEEGFEIKGKVKKTLPSSSCVSIAVGDEFGLYVRKDGREGNPLQESLDYQGENEILGAKNKKIINE